MAEGNTSVGRISLDIDLSQDLEKEIGNTAAAIGEKLQNGIGKGLNIDGLLKSFASNIQNTVKSSMDGFQRIAENSFNSIEMKLNSTIDAAKENAISAVKDITASLKNIKGPTNIVNAVPAVVKSPSIPNVKTGIDANILSAMIDNVSRSLDTTNAMIEQQQAKLAQLKQSYASTFNEARKNKLEEQILQTEKKINGLIATSDKLGFKLSDLDTQFEVLGNSARGATSGVDSMNNKLSETSRKAVLAGDSTGKAGYRFSLFGSSASGSANKSSTSMNMLGRVLDRMLIRMVLLNTVIKALSTVATFTGNALMTNTAFANSLAQIKSNLEVAFMPIYQAVLPALTTLMNALARITTYVAAFISALFGKTYQQSANAAKSLNTSIQTYKAMEEQSKKTGSAVEGIGSSAEKAAKKAKGALSGFDQINKLSITNQAASADKAPTVPTGAGMGVPIVAPPVDISPASTAMTKITAIVNAFKKILSTIFQPFKSAWEAVGPGVIAGFKNAVSSTEGTLRHFFNTLASPPVQKFLTDIGILALSLVKLALRIYDGFILPVVNWFIGKLPSAASGLDPIINKATDLVNFLSGNGFPAVQAFLGAVLGWKAMETTIGIIKNVKDGVETLALKAMYAKDDIVKLGNGIIDCGKSIIDFTAKLGKIAWDAAVRGAIALKDGFVSVGSAALEGIKVLGEFIISLTKTAAGFVIATAKAGAHVIALGLHKAATLASAIAEGILSAAQAALNFVMSLNPITLIIIAIGALIAIIATLYNKCSWFRNGVKAIFSDIWSGIKWVINAITGGINVLIKGLNHLKLPKIDIPGIGTIGGWGFNIPLIPRLAEGGIVDKKTLFMAGEAGKEAVMPLKNNTAWISELAGKIGSMIMPIKQPKIAFAPSGDIESNVQATKSDSEKTSLKDEIKEAFIEAIKSIKSNEHDNDDGNFIIQVDGDNFARIAIKQLNRRRKRTGITELEV